MAKPAEPITPLERASDPPSAPLEQDDEERKPRKMVRDAEIIAMGEIAEILDRLDEKAMSRVVDYLAKRYCPAA